MGFDNGPQANPLQQALMSVGPGVQDPSGIVAQAATRVPEVSIGQAEFAQGPLKGPELRDTREATDLRRRRNIDAEREQMVEQLLSQPEFQAFFSDLDALTEKHLGVNDHIDRALLGLLERGGLQGEIRQGISNQDATDSIAARHPELPLRGSFFSGYSAVEGSNSVALERQKAREAQTAKKQARTQTKQDERFQRVEQGAETLSGLVKEESADKAGKFLVGSSGLKLLGKLTRLIGG